MKKQNFLFIIVVIFCLSLSVGYAVFSKNIKVNGTATAKGNFDVVFENAKVKAETGSTGATAIVSEDKNTLTLNVPKLEYPGAYAEFTVDITNSGTIPAQLIGITESNLNTSSSIRISYSGVQKDEIMAQGDKKTVTVKVEWLYESIEGAKDIEFSIKLDYQQIIL